MTDRQAAIDAKVKELFADIEFTKEPEGLYDPLRYMIAIGGKRIRPTLALIAYSLYRDRLDEEIFEPAVALEVFHTFTLIHDDIMDRSPLRRGQPTVWKKWKEDTAILSGDVMLIDAYRRIAKAPARCAREVLELFTETAAEVCEGQQYDMDFESLPTVSMDEYAKMIGLKTAVLIACSAKIGALIAGAPAKDCEALYNYGYQLGMAFQVADDYLDAYGDEKVFGKPIGGDIVNGKKSWMILKALEKAGDGKQIREAMSIPEPKARIAAVKSCFDALGVPQDAQSEIRRYSGLALEAVGGFSPEARAVLEDFVWNLVGRAK